MALVASPTTPVMDDNSHPAVMRIRSQRLVRAVAVVDEGGGKVRLDFHVQSALYKMVHMAPRPLYSIHFI